MTQRFLVAALIISSLMSATLLVAYWRTAHAEASKPESADKLAESGTDFCVQNRLVRATLYVGPAEVRPNDSIEMVLTLNPLQGACTGVGNEHDGVLSPDVTAGDCAVETSQNDAVATQSMIPAFRWDRSITCQNEGEKLLHIKLSFQPTHGENDSDPVAYETVREFSVVKSPMERVLAFVAAISVVAPLISAIALLIKRGGARTS